jgi:hypothetical protein
MSKRTVFFSLEHCSDRNRIREVATDRVQGVLGTLRDQLREVSSSRLSACRISNSRRLDPQCQRGCITSQVPKRKRLWEESRDVPLGQ